MVSYKKQLSIFMFGMVVTSSMFATGQVQAEIFKCVNQQGEVYYNDKPCAAKDIETQIRNTQDPKKRGGQPQEFSNLQVVDEYISGKELTDLRNQQRFDFMRKQLDASENDKGMVPSSEDGEPPRP